MRTSKIFLIIALLVGVISIALGFIAYLIGSAEWSLANILLSLSISLFQLLLGIIIVNIYLTNAEKRKMQIATIDLLVGDIKVYMLDFLSNVRQFNEEEKSSLKSKDSVKLSPELSNKFKVVFTENYGELINDMDICLQQLNIFGLTGALDADDRIVFQYLGANRVFNKIKTLDIQDPDCYKEIYGLFHMFLTLMLELVSIFETKVSVKERKKYLERLMKRDERYIEKLQNGDSILCQ